MNPVIVLGRRAARLDARAANQARHDYEHVYRSLRTRLVEAYGPGMRHLRILDFGCGYTYPLLVLLQKDVGEAVGLDIAPVYRDGWQPFLPWGLKKPGAVAECMLRYAQATRYYRHLERCSHIPPRHEVYKIVRYDGAQIPFDEGAFDCVISNAVLQELPLPLDRYAREMARVLKPGGLVDVEWHSFYSWSGHYLGEEESRRSPWGHLINGRYHPCLNRATPDGVAEAFSPCFAGIRLLGHDRQYRIAGQDPDYRPEGAEYLTPELQARLTEYPREWLLTRGYILQGWRR